MEIGLLVIRLVVGLALAAHGAQKLFGWFGGHGIAGTGGFFESLGLRPGNAMAVTAGLGEFAGGLGLAAGFLTPLAAAVVIATMLTASLTFHAGKGFFATEGGYELPVTYAAVAAGLAFTGAGRISIDHAVGLYAWYGPRWGLIALGLGLAGAAGALAVRAVQTRRRAHA
jgi:putative oxidoreductase